MFSNIRKYFTVRFYTDKIYSVIVRGLVEFFSRLNFLTSDTRATLYILSFFFSVILVSLLIILGVLFVYWILWGIVAGFIWATGPRIIIDPTFIEFLAAYCLVLFVHQVYKWTKR